jgi:hypothetical protein
MRVSAGFREFMIKKGQSGDQIDDHNIGELGFHPEASCGEI